jgi:hypothetical protein
MLNWLRLSVAVVLGLMLWTAIAEGQARKIDAAQWKVTVREADGTVHEFLASPETLKDLC